MTWFNIVTVSFLMCVFPNLDKVKINFESEQETSQQMTPSESLNDIIQIFLTSMKS